MTRLRLLFFIALLPLCYTATAQKTVEGLKFSACLNNEKLSPQFYKGKFLVLDFWATWCGPCIASFPKVDLLEKRYRDNPDVVFAAITAERKGLVDSFFHRRDGLLPGAWHLVDDAGATWQYFDVSAIPNMLVFAPSGKMVFSGRIEELAKCMDSLLKGADLSKPAQQPAAPDKWTKYKETASFIAITGPAAAADPGGSNTNFNKDRSKAFLRMDNEALVDVLSSLCNISSMSFAYNDSVKANQPINVCYKQAKNDYPEFDKGLCAYQYQNHLLNVLEHTYAFHSQWVTERVTAYKIVVKDKQLLAKAATLSTKGSYSSTNDKDEKKRTYVNQTLTALAASAEDNLNVSVFADAATEGYDVELTLSSLQAFERSLAMYGLAVEKVEGHEVRKFKMTFE